MIVDTDYSIYTGFCIVPDRPFFLKHPEAVLVKEPDKFTKLHPPGLIELLSGKIVAKLGAHRPSY